MRQWPWVRHFPDGKELGVMFDGKLHSEQRGHGSDEVTVFAHVISFIQEPSPPKFKSLASLFFHSILRCPL